MDVPQTDRLRVEIDPGPMLRAFARHRRRFADSVTSLDDEALARPTRCTEWSVADVLRHCCDVDEWFRAGAAGDPTPLQDSSFDAITTPHELFKIFKNSIYPGRIKSNFRPLLHVPLKQIIIFG